MFKEEMKMKSFSYTVKDELGIHARPAGMLVKEVKNFQSKVTLEKDGKSVDASRLMAVMGMGVKKKSDCDCNGRRRRRRCSM